METAILCSSTWAAIRKSLTDPLKQQRTSKIKMYACWLFATMIYLGCKNSFQGNRTGKRNIIGTYRTIEETLLYDKDLLILLLSNNYVWEHILREHHLYIFSIRHYFLTIKGPRNKRLDALVDHQKKPKNHSLGTTKSSKCPCYSHDFMPKNRSEKRIFSLWIPTWNLGGFVRFILVI